MHYEPTKAKTYKKPTHKNKITVIDGEELEKDMNREQLKQTKQMHRKAIAQSRADIRKHRLLIRQAKLTYKLSK